MFGCESEYREERFMNTRVREEDITMLMLIDRLDKLIEVLDKNKKDGGD